MVIVEAIRALYKPEPWPVDNGEMMCPHCGKITLDGVAVMYWTDVESVKYKNCGWETDPYEALKQFEIWGKEAHNEGNE